MEVILYIWSKKGEVYNNFVFKNLKSNNQYFLLFSSNYDFTF